MSCPDKYRELLERGAPDNYRDPHVTKPWTAISNFYKNPVFRMVDNAKDIFKLYIKKFTPLTEQEFEVIFSYFKEQKLKKNEYFIRQGQICNNVAFIINGILRVNYINENGDDITSCFCTESSLTTSYKSMVAKEPSLLNIQALSNVELFVISYTDLKQLQTKSFAWQQFIQLVLQNEYFNLEKYISVLNNETAIDKYQRLLKEQPQIIQNAPIQYISSYLGVTRRTLSRIRGEIARKNRTI